MGTDERLIQEITHLRRRCLPDQMMKVCQYLLSLNAFFFPIVTKNQGFQIKYSSHILPCRTIFTFLFVTFKSMLSQITSQNISSVELIKVQLCPQLQKASRSPINQYLLYLVLCQTLTNKKIIFDFQWMNRLRITDMSIFQLTICLLQIMTIVIPREFNHQ